ncbi:ribonucleoside-diphosphate reductase subunit alpha [Laribacter hongkongensis]|uniref:ribonucleoside-diphosphate reductase subunit alpha n=1 Tax=Laribacter hongkongensis TaxID=168471 RepID=UPI0027E50E18|nr:ribonucleoside-diphosphate reductase subunit alpha [Laribacter hongkongensis]
MLLRAGHHCPARVSREKHRMTTTVTASCLCIRRTGDVVPFNADKIALAMRKAFIAVQGESAGQSSRLRDEVARLTQDVVNALTGRRPEGSAIAIEDIQDQVELALMRSGEHEVARAYVLYREARAAERRARHAALGIDQLPALHVTRPDGSRAPLDIERLGRQLEAACHGLEADTRPAALLADTLKNLYDGVTEAEVERALILSARQWIERDPAYDKVTARLLLDTIRREVAGGVAATYAEVFRQGIQRGMQADLLDPRLADFDLPRLAAALDGERDRQFGYLGLQTLYDRYFLHVDGRRIEMPQTFFMRVAMGLALNEADPTTQAMEFYDLLSRFDFMSSTPTLFNAGTRHSQLSSCYLTTIADSLDGIFDAIKENAQLSKFAGGLGNDWTPVRALGSHIKGTNGQSQGVVPFLKVANDTAVAVNQGGKRKGAVCAYLETWHLDIEEFLELRKNTGDDRRRTHDMNTANWIPDLFMQRVMENAEWTLFSPADVPDLHDLTGRAFARRYAEYEAMARAGTLRNAKTLRAVDLWRKMLTMLFETGHPWLTWKDACNLRSPQQHVGRVHSSNLCTEITLNTSDDEIAVCNLGSVNLANHLKEGALDQEKLARTVRVAMRMLDNVIDLNFYPVEKARTANLRHRPVGLGVMGFQDCLHLLRLPYGSQAAVGFADESMELIAYHAYLASTELAEMRGCYPSFEGSLWSQGILPQDSVELLAAERQGYLEVDRSSRLDWTPVRERIARFGMRNSNCLAIAPTATIANIIGVSASIEPTYKNLFVKSNLSGEFTVVNEFLVQDLKRLGLWDAVMLADLKYFDGDLAPIERIPQDIKTLYATAFDIEPGWLVEAASRRQKWIDQAQSLNLYMAGASGKKLDTLYKLAWVRGLKTTYYLRTLAATSAEKSTGRGGELNAVPVEGGMVAEPKFCSIDNPDCEACQ